MSRKKVGLMEKTAESGLMGRSLSFKYGNRRFLKTFLLDKAGLP